MGIRVRPPSQLLRNNLSNRTKTILRKNSRSRDFKKSLLDFIENRIYDLISDELDLSPDLLDFSTVLYEPVWTMKKGERLIKYIRLSKNKDFCHFTKLDICIVEAYNLEMEEVVDFLGNNNAKKSRFKRS
jgi:hypothetical protein